MNLCNRLKSNLAETGLSAVHGDPTLTDHLQACPHCQALLQAYELIPELLAALPEHEPDSSLLKVTENTVRFGPAKAARIETRWRPVAPALAASLVALCVIGLYNQVGFYRDAPLSAQIAENKRPNAKPSRQAAGESHLANREMAVLEEAEELGAGRAITDGNESGDMAGNFGDDSLSSTSLQSGLSQSAQSSAPDAPGSAELPDGNSAAAREVSAIDAYRAPRSSMADSVQPEAAPELDRIEVTGSRINRTDIESASPVFVVPRGAVSSESEASLETSEVMADYDNDPQEKELRAKAVEVRRRVSEQRASLIAEPAERNSNRLVREHAPQKIEADVLVDSSAPVNGAKAKPISGADNTEGYSYWRDAGATSPADQLANGETDLEYKKDRNKNQSFASQLASSKGSVDPNGPAMADPRDGPDGGKLKQEALGGALSGSFENTQKSDFFDQYASIQGLTFQDPRGYWANTYVPGDPEIRLLSARLADWDRSGLGDDGRLEQLVSPPAQPFDAPSDNSLALSLMADANAVDGPTRMRLQVGIQGIADRLGHRPSMNVGIVVDLPADATDPERIAVRALLDALLASKQAGDRFSLVFSGGPDELAVTPAAFRFGPLQVAKEWVFGQGDERQAGGIKLRRALEIAADTVRKNDDPSQPLGSSSILLISAGDLNDIEALTLLAHRQAADGVVLSVVPLGQRPEPERVERLVLAGLGNRRFLESPDLARQLVVEELHSASRAVARAVRLSIRLAQGVQLIEVIGSRRLDDPAAERVREIEQSMDQRLSSNLGILADRGEDEDGIQIVIPSVFAGDSLTILLDVLVSQAGPVAEVSLRYKDLVFLRNGVLGGQLELPRGVMARGSVELAVMKNLLAHQFAESTRQAASLLGRQQLDQAQIELSGMYDLLVQARAWTPAWHRDPELQRDQQVLANYLKLLSSPLARPVQSLLADSLRYAAWRKSHWPPKEWKP